VRPDSVVDKKFEWQKNIPAGQDVDMTRISKMCRQLQPGIIIVDRWVPGPYENYHTPEQQIPDKPLPYPWETCMTMAGSWSYVPNDKYKSTNTIIHNLVDIVSKGGNYLLNIAPGPDGEWHDDAYVKLKEIGEWMKLNGEAIYNTRPIAPYKENNICFTQSKDNKKIYMQYMRKENEMVTAEISFKGIEPGSKAVVSVVSNGKKLSWKKENGTIKINLPKGTTAQHAIVLKIIM